MKDEMQTTIRPSTGSDETSVQPSSFPVGEASPALHPSTRWRIAAAGTRIQVCLGTAYAWSYFQNPLRDAFGWTNSLTAWAFCLAICFLGLAAAVGGVLLPKVGPARLAMAGGFLFGLGYVLGHGRCMSSRRSCCF